MKLILSALCLALTATSCTVAVYDHPRHDHQKVVKQRKVVRTERKVIVKQERETAKQQRKADHQAQVHQKKSHHCKHKVKAKSCKKCIHANKKHKKNPKHKQDHQPGPTVASR